MQGALPSGGQLAVGAGAPMGAGVVDYLASAPEQRIWWILRHEQDLTAAITGGTIDWFAVTTSAAQDGNVERAGTIPEPQIFFVFGVTFRAASRATIADLGLILDSLYLTISINNRTEFGPINVAHIPAGGGIHGSSSTTVAATTVETATNGLPSGQLINWLPVPLVEKGGEFFRYRTDVAITLAALSVTTRAEMAQHGMLFRRAVSQ